MAVSLLRGPDFTSLEFASEDLDAVKAAIRDLFGVPQVAQHLIAATVTIKGEDFTFQNEWDDPCLITKTSRGAEILQAIAFSLDHKAI